MPPKTTGPQASADGGGGNGGGYFRDRDPPPGYDGREPDRTFPRWLKELKLWEYETEIPKEKWGVKLLRQLTGSARATADNLSFEDIACEKGMENLVKALTDHFSPHLESSLPQAFESAIYGEPRGSRESFGDYVIRMEYAFKELERQKVPLHDIAVGYVMFRHANLNEVQQSQMLTWGKGSYDRKTVVENLRRLDKGNFDARRKGPSHYVTEVENEDDCPDLTNETYVGEFLPEEGESDLDEDYVYIGENDMQEVIDEDQMLEALATYQDVRRSLREQRTGRGYYPQGKSSSASSGGKGKGKGSFEGKGRPTLATKGRDKVKFTRHGTRVHVDMLKLRTRCAGCGQVGHWAKECRNAPDERGRASAARASSASTQQSSIASTPSVRSGFFVQSSEADGPASKAFCGATQTFYGEGKEKDLMSYVPTFGSILRAVSRQRFSEQSPLRQVVPDEPVESFVGISTHPNEGVVDTAAQDGLIGKASLLQLAQALREKGLQYRWNPKKKAQASGVGGRAEVIGVAEVPVGIAGVNGLMELTVVTDNVPLLLPIKMLRQLRAIVDLDSDTLELKAFGVKTPMTKLPSGHMSVDVLSFAPEGWSLPRDAESNNLSQEQFVLVSSSYVNHSMTSLERPSVRKVKFEAANHGADAPSAYVGSTRAGPPGHSRENVWSRGAEQARHEEMACDNGQDDRSCGVDRRPRKSLGLASRWLLATVGTSILAGSGPVSFYPKLIGDYGTSARQAVGVCGDHQVCGLFGNAEGQGASPYECGKVHPPDLGAEGWREPVWEGHPLCTVPGQMGVPQPGGTQEEADRGQDVPAQSVEDFEGSRIYGANDGGADVGRKLGASVCDSDVSLPGAGVPLAGQEVGTHSGEAFLPMCQAPMRVLCLGRDREDGAEAQAGCPSDPADGGRRDRSPGRALCAGPGWWFSDSACRVTGDGLPEDVGPESLCLVQTQAQLVTARRAQMRTFCPRASAPWEMSMSRVFYQWNAADERWQERVGWLPKEICDEIFMVMFNDEASMVMWSEEEGKLKALSASQKKLADRQAQRLLQDMESEKHCEVQEAVSPSLSSPCFVSDGGMMAILDPSCHEQFWCQLGSAKPSHLVLRPSRDRESLCLACEAAEWQHLNGKAFLIVHSDQDREYVEDMLDSEDLRGRRVQCKLPDGLAMTGNAEYFLKSAMEAKMRRVSFTAQDLDGLSQNQKAHQENVDGLHQNQEAHHENVDGLRQNQEAHQENVDGLRQNQEAHHVVFNFDVCQEHGGGQHNCRQEHGGGLSSEVECFASASEMAEVEEAASRLMRQKDYSMVSLEKFLMKFPKLCSKGRQSDMQGTYYLFGLYAHGAKCGTTNSSRKLANFTRYLNELVSYQAECRGLGHATWSSIALGLNAGSRPHKDHHNKVDSRNYIFGVGSYSGGELWVESDESLSTSSAICSWKWSPQGMKVAGRNYDIKYKMIEFDPRKWRASCKWTGQRIVVSAFTSRGVDFATDRTLRELRELGFRLPQDRRVYMFDGSFREGVGQFSSVFAEEEDEPVEAAGEDAEIEVEPVVEQADWEPNVSRSYMTTSATPLLEKWHGLSGWPTPSHISFAMWPGIFDVQCVNQGSSRSQLDLLFCPRSTSQAVLWVWM